MDEWHNHVLRLTDQTTEFKAHISELKRSLRQISLAVEKQSHTLEQRVKELRQSLEESADVDQPLYRLPCVLKILDHPEIGGILVGPDGRYLLFNATARRILGPNLAKGLDSELLEAAVEPLLDEEIALPDGHQGADFDGLFLEDKVTRCADSDLPWHRCAGGIDTDESVLLVRRQDVADGIWIRTISMQVRNDQGRSDGAVAFLLDTTEQVNVEAQVKELLETFEQQLRSIERAQGMLTELARTLSLSNSTAEPVELGAAVLNARTAKTPGLSGARPQSLTPGSRESSNVALVVDDMQVNQKLLVLQLERFGFVVEAARDGKEAVEMVVRGNYDIVFMDLDMPVMDGPSATREIRNVEKRTFKHVPIVAMTSYKKDADRARCLDSGMDDYLAKGANRSQLVDVLNRFVRRQGDVLLEPVRREEPPVVSQKDDPEAEIERLRTVYGDKETANISRLFVSSAETFVDCLKLAVDEKNGDAIVHFAHCIKGPAEIIGINHLVQILTDMIDAAESEDWTTVSLKYMKLRAKSSTVLNRFTELFEAERAAAT